LEASSYIIKFAVASLGHAGNRSITTPYMLVSTMQVDKASATFGRTVLGSVQEASKKRAGSPACARAGVLDKGEEEEARPGRSRY